MSKTYNFEIEMNNVGKGYVVANSLEEAISKIKNGEYEDIYDESFLEFGELIDIWED
jgi:hypothetical protein